MDGLTSFHTPVLLHNHAKKAKLTLACTCIVLCELDFLHMTLKIHRFHTFHLAKICYLFMKNSFYYVVFIMFTCTMYQSFVTFTSKTLGFNLFLWLTSVHGLMSIRWVVWKFVFHSTQKVYTYLSIVTLTFYHHVILLPWPTIVEGSVILHWVVCLLLCSQCF